MNLFNSTKQDIEQLSDWIKADPYHRDCLDPAWWLTGMGFLSYCLQDDKGPTMYVRLDKDNNLMRIHCQFAPESEVNKKRVLRSLNWALPKMEIFARESGSHGLVYKSTSDSLINYMTRKFGFFPVGGDDYQLSFEVA